MSLFKSGREQKIKTRCEILAGQAVDEIRVNEEAGLNSSWFNIGAAPKGVSPADFMRQVGGRATEIARNAQSYDHEASEVNSLRFNEHGGELTHKDQLYLCFRHVVQADVELVPVA